MISAVGPRPGAAQYCVRDVHTQNPNLVSPQEVENAESRVQQGRRPVERAVRARGLRRRRGCASPRRGPREHLYPRTVRRHRASQGSGGGGSGRAVGRRRSHTRRGRDHGRPRDPRVEVDVNEAYYRADLRAASRARITLDAYPDTAFPGTVRQVVPTADRQRATVQVKVAIVVAIPASSPRWAPKWSSCRRRAWPRAPRSRSNGENHRAGGSGALRQQPRRRLDRPRWSVTRSRDD